MAEAAPAKNGKKRAMAFTTARAFCKPSCGGLQNGLAPAANIGSLPVYLFLRGLFYNFYTLSLE